MALVSDGKQRTRGSRIGGGSDLGEVDDTRQRSALTEQNASEEHALRQGKNRPEALVTPQTPPSFTEMLLERVYFRLAPCSSVVGADTDTITLRTVLNLRALNLRAPLAFRSTEPPPSPVQSAGNLTFEGGSHQDPFGVGTLGGSSPLGILSEFEPSEFELNADYSGVRTEAESGAALAEILLTQARGLAAKSQGAGAVRSGAVQTDLMPALAADVPVKGEARPAVGERAQDGGDPNSGSSFEHGYFVELRDRDNGRLIDLISVAALSELVEEFGLATVNLRRGEGLFKVFLAREIVGRYFSQKLE